MSKQQQTWEVARQPKGRQSEDLGEDALQAAELGRGPIYSSLA